MNKIPKIIKRQPPEATQEVTNWVFSPEEPPASELVEPVKVPTPPEQLEALYVPPLSDYLKTPITIFSLLRYTLNSLHDFEECIQYWGTVIGAPNKFQHKRY